MSPRAAPAFNREAADFVWRAKYRRDGEEDVADTWRRMARAVASVEADPETWAARFGEALDGFAFLPGGRIAAGAGADPEAVLFNCFVLPGPGADLGEALSALGETVATLRAGGGVGIDLSAVPPRGTGRPASPGPVAYLELWDAASRSLLADAPRRGAMMGALSCRHPDVAAFAEAKAAPGALSRFNLSIAISDDFMAAVRAGADWTLRFPAGEPWAGGVAGAEAGVVRARDLWDRILRSAFETGEPGVLFVDRINRANALGWRERIAVTNPCGEIPLPDYGACDLGSLNLPVFVRAPFADEARLDLDALARAAATAVRFLDDVIDLSAYPLEPQRAAALASRRVGLGLTGLGDALVMLNLRYGEPASLSLAGEIMRTIRDAAYRASAALAREKGPFPLFDAERYLGGEFAAALPPDIRRQIADHGLRNSHLLAIAPTGSISLVAGAVSTGLEPIYARTQMRRILGRDGAPREFRLVDPALALWRRTRGDTAGEPPAMVTAHELSIAAHLDMQAALQPFVDNAISKTVNVAPDLPFAAFADIYDQAFDRGLKGCTVFRSAGGPATPLGECAPEQGACAR
ncbi:adenosylcobalamin-dependent ribonucleoside-diphosphate reductase [Phenylobacterium sp.]|uniref:adenosylcobalamin-dependent ribonucleoside-diphosphate reductase n=1 Tax=Phenylobacterium sp. TaxID=1871053 RepID=UPI0035B4EB8A